MTSTTYEFIQESIKLIYHCPKATSSISKYIWLEHEEIFGSSSSNQDLSTQPSEGTAATTEFEPTSQLCVICLSDPAQVIVQPCRHCCTCIECWRLDSTVQVVNSTSAGSNVPSTPQSPQNPEVDKVTERISVKWTTCPVCRGSVEGWVEMNDTVHLKFKQSVPSE